MKRFAIALAALAFVTTSCNKDDDGGDTTQPVDGTEVVSGVLSADVTWNTNNADGSKTTYILDGRVIVPEGVTLKIAPGTLIKGKEGLETNASVLIVARGGNIRAEGTADEPIIFTSELDNIEPGQMVGSNLDRTQNELWGGIIVLGAAPISAEDGDTETTIEGLPADEEYAKYGGSNASDNSGVMQYVSIRHGGISIGDGNEINGLTLGGVGNGSTFDNIEIYATLDDGIEFFGGSTDMTNALVNFQGDDGVDIDMNYSGTVDNFMVIHGDGIGTDEGLEIDGPEGSTHTDGMFILKNGTVKSIGSEGTAGDFKSKAQGTVMNVEFIYSAGAEVKIRASYQNDCADQKTDAWTNLVNDGKLVFTDNTIDAITVYTGSEASDGSECSVAAGAQASAEAMIISTTDVGADPNAFAWTATAQRGEL